MQQQVGLLGMLTRRLLVLLLVAASSAACTSETQPAELGEELAVGSGAPTPSSPGSALPAVRAPACLGQPTPTASPQYSRSYIDFVHLGGRLYALADVQPPSVVGGRRQGVVRCVYDDARAPAERGVMEGDASRLLPGTALLAHPAVDGRRALVADRPEGALLYVHMLDEGLGPRPSS